MMLERLGVPTVTLVSAAFEGYARLRSSALGVPELPLLVLPHPLADKSEGELSVLMASRFHAVLAAWYSQLGTDVPHEDGAG